MKFQIVTSRIPEHVSIVKVLRGQVPPLPLGK